MSCHTHKTCESLSPYTRDGPGGETPTTTTQDNFAQRLRGVLSRINARIREAVITEDLFNLRSEALVDDPPENIFETSSRQRAVSGFIQWLRNQLDENYLTIVGPDRNQFVDVAYAAGIREAQKQLSDLDVAFEREDVDDVIGRPVHRSALQTLYTRVYENLESVRDDVVQDVRDTLVEGFAEGKSPTDIANNLTNRVDSIGKHRSTMIARSEVINAHSQGTLNTVEDINKNNPEVEDEVIVGHGEWNAAMGQPNTCPFCRRLNGTPLRAREMATGVVQFRGDIYRLSPPAHPNGRCSISVRVGPSGIDTPLSERLPAEITQIT